MGVKNLWDILESCKRTFPLHHLQNKRLCVDLSCWMVQLQCVNKSHCPLRDKLYLKSLFHRVRSLIALNCSLIFVTDGKIPGIKLSTYRRRLNSGNEAIPDAQISSYLPSVKRNMGSEFSCMIKEAKLLGLALGIPCLNGLEEAEAQCALLNLESLCDGCFTSDSDAFLFGARTVYRDICLGEGGYVVCYEMDDIERELGFGRNSLIALAILLGSDYTHGVRGFGPEAACQLVKSIGDATVLQRFASEGFEVTKKQKKSRNKGVTSTSQYKETNANNQRDLNGNECDAPIDNQFMQVINAYLKPTCHSADSDIVHRVLALYPFDRNQLHQIFAQYFDWPSEKTDEYILPKVAERNLRRFANLRSTSSELGVHVPINEMPVKCPVSSIVKHRKIQGRDYFEVSWEDMDGLTASSVPAHLLESACPEKITEFLQRKAQKQKPARRSRPKKAADMKDIDRKLQQLMLDIEQESSTTTMINYVTLENLVPEKSHSVATMDSESSSRDVEGSKSRESSSSTTSRYAETEIVNLVSPSPRLRTCKVSKFPEIHGSQPMKPDKRVGTVEIDEELEKLLLDIELESFTMTTRINSEDGHKSDNRGSSSSGYSSTTSKIIDLVSPPPRVHAQSKVLKYHEARCADVIELSDTDNDII